MQISPSTPANGTEGEKKTTETSSASSSAAAPAPAASGDSTAVVPAKEEKDEGMTVEEALERIRPDVRDAILQRRCTFYVTGKNFEAQP
jgi:hypothetical protein